MARETDGLLTFQLGDTPVTLRDGSAAVDVGEFEWTLPAAVRRTADGEYLTPSEAATLLDCIPYADAWTGSLLLKSFPATERGRFLSLTCTRGDAASWRQLWETTRSKWVADGKGIIGEVLLRKPEKLAGIEILRGDAPLRNARMKIEVSADGRRFETVFDGETASRQIAYEALNFPAREVRLIRIMFNGNNENLRNGLLGVKLIPAEID